MIKYFCDMRGTETANSDNAAGPAAELCGLYDLCPRCCALAKGLDIAQVDAIPAVGITGRGAASAEAKGRPGDGAAAHD